MTFDPNSPEAPLEILVVEDNPQEARLLEEAFKTADGACSLRLMIDCRKVADYLREEYKKPQGYRPHVVLLDYRMPLNGGATLRKLKYDPVLCYLPVIIVTGCHDESAIYDLYVRGANCCFRKPDDFGGYETLARLIAAALRSMFLPRPPDGARAKPRGGLFT